MNFHISKIFKNQSSYGDVNYHIAKQHPLLKSTTAREHSKHRNIVVDYSMADLISAEYEQDCCHSVLSEMKIGDDEVSWRVEY